MNTDGLKNGIEIQLHIDDVRAILQNMRKYINEDGKGHLAINDLIKDCSYHEGSYLVEDKTQGENIMSGYGFYLGKNPLRFFHIKKG